MLTAAGKKTDILLPRLIANSAGLEVMGADPAFLPGRISTGGEQPGASTIQDLRKILESGGIRAALIIGENPLEYNRTGSWFQNVEFLAAVDWADTETTRFADVTLPGSTYLETPGTRCNFEGKLTAFTRAVSPPSGMTATEVLACLAKSFGLDIAGDLFDEIDRIVKENLGDLTRFYWNTGEKRNWDGEGKLVAIEADVKATSILPPMTHSQEYRKEIREVGTERFRVL